MDNESLKRIKKEIKQKHKNQEQHVYVQGMKKRLLRYVSKTLIVVCLALAVLITLKGNAKLKKGFYQQVYEQNITFTQINQWYQGVFGSPIPFQNLFKDQLQTVFQETLEYQEANKYKDGVKLTVVDKYLVPTIESGLVIFIGEKDGYENTVIIQQVNGIDVWYSNVKNISVTLYDYVDKGVFLAEAMDQSLILIFKRNGEVLDYQAYL